MHIKFSLGFEQGLECLPRNRTCNSDTGIKKVDLSQITKTENTNIILNVNYPEFK